jgi:hypothetical protein
MKMHREPVGPQGREQQFSRSSRVQPSNSGSIFGRDGCREILLWSARNSQLQDLEAMMIPPYDKNENDTTL